MKKKLLATTIMLLMVASSLSLFAGGADVEFSNLEEGQVLNTKVLEVEGYAQPTPDEWVQKTENAFLQGSLNNVTLTEDEDLTVDPYIGEFNKDPNNPLVAFGGNHTYNEYGADLGALIKDGSTYKMWSVGINRSYSMNIAYSTSTDGKSFSHQNCTFPMGDPGDFDEVMVIPGTVIKDGSTYKMWYTGEDAQGIYRIGYATSNDGVTWTRGNGGDPVMDLGPINKFDGGGTATPAVIKDGNTFKMWYSGLIAYSGNLWQMGYATSSDGINWDKKNNGDPVLSFGASTAHDKDGVIYPSVIKDGDVYRAWYVGIPTTVVGYAYSSDGVNWERGYQGAPVLGQGSGGAFDQGGLTSVVTIRVGNNYRLYYTGMNNYGEPQIGMAKASLMGLEGIFTSTLFDAGLEVNWGEVELTSDTPSGTSIEFEMRGSNDRVEWSEWSALENGTESPVDEAQFVQYKITMVSPDGITKPTVDVVRIVYEVIERIEVSTDNSTWFLATGTYEWNVTIKLQEGLNTIFVRVVDTTGVPTYSSIDVVVDSIKPTGILQINSDDKYTTDPHVDITLSALDASGVAEMRLATTDNMTGIPWQNFSTSADINLPEGDGTKTVYCQLKDTTGLVSDLISDSIILDTTEPNGSVALKDGAPMTTFKGVMVTLSATDANGVSKMRLGNDENFTGSEWKTYAATTDWSLEGNDGEKTVYVEFMDKAGNTAVFEDTIILDTTSPTGSMVINGGEEISTERWVDITFSAYDENGVSYVMIANGPDFLDSVWQTLNETMPWKLEERLGPQTVYAKFKDSAGLVSNVVSDDIILDIHEEGFEGTVEINHGEKYTNNQTLEVGLTLIGDEGHSKVMVSEFEDFQGAEWQPFNDTVFYTTTTADGKLTLYVKFRDRYGIVSEVVSDSIKIDTTPPEVTVLEPEEGSKVHKAIVTVRGEATDNMALKMVEVQLPNGQWIPVSNPENYTSEINLVDKGDHTLTVRATDEAGNTQTSSVMIKYKEKDTEDTVPGFEVTALVFGTILVVLYLSRRRIPRV